jgi:hypothetical protein
MVIRTSSENLHVIFSSGTVTICIAPLELAPWYTINNKLRFRNYCAIRKLSKSLLVPCPCPCLCLCICPVPAHAPVPVRVSVRDNFHNCHKNIYVRHGNYLVDSQGLYKVVRKLKGLLSHEGRWVSQNERRAPLPLRKTYWLTLLLAKSISLNNPCKWHRYSTTNNNWTKEKPVKCMWNSCH